MDAPDYLQSSLSNTRYSRENKRIFKKNLLKNSNKSLSTPLSSIPNLTIFDTNKTALDYKNSLSPGNSLNIDIKAEKLTPSKSANSIIHPEQETKLYESFNSINLDDSPGRSSDKYLPYGLSRNFEGFSSFAIGSNKNNTNGNVGSTDSKNLHINYPKLDRSDSESSKLNIELTSKITHRKSFDFTKKHLFKNQGSFANKQAETVGKSDRLDKNVYAEDNKASERSWFSLKSQADAEQKAGDTELDKVPQHDFDKISMSSTPTNLTKKLESTINLEDLFNQPKNQQQTRSFYELNPSTSAKSLYNPVNDPVQTQNKPLAKVNSILVAGGIIQNFPVNADSDFIESLIRKNSTSVRSEAGFLTRSLTDASESKLNNSIKAVEQRNSVEIAESENGFASNSFDAKQLRMKHSKTSFENSAYNNSASRNTKSSFFDSSSEFYGSPGRLLGQEFLWPSKPNFTKPPYVPSEAKADHKFTQDFKTSDMIVSEPKNFAEKDSLLSNFTNLEDKNSRDTRKPSILKNDHKMAFSSNHLGMRKVPSWLNANLDPEDIPNTQYSTTNPQISTKDTLSAKHSFSPEVSNYYHAEEELNSTSSLRTSQKHTVESYGNAGNIALQGLCTSYYTGEDKSDLAISQNSNEEIKPPPYKPGNKGHSHLETKSNTRWASFASAPNSEKLAILAGQEGLVMVDLNTDPILKLSNLAGKQKKSVNMDFRDVLWLPSNTIVTGSSSGSILFWDPNVYSRPNPRAVINASNRAINRLASQPEEPSVLFSAFQDGFVMGFDERVQTKSSKSSSTISFKTGPSVANDISFDPTDKNNLAVANGNGRVGLWDLRQTKSPYFNILAHSASRAQCVSWNESGQFLASGGSDGLISVWNINGTESTAFRSNSALRYTKPAINSAFSAFTIFYTPSHVKRISWRPGHPTQLASCSLDSDFSINVWDMRQPSHSTFFHNRHTDAVTSLMWRNGSQLWSCGNDGRFMACDMDRDFCSVSKYISKSSVAVGLYDEAIVAFKEDNAKNTYMDDYVGNQALSLNALNEILETHASSKPKIKTKLLENLYKMQPSHENFYPQRTRSSLNEVKLEPGLGTNFDEILFFAANYIIESDNLNEAFVYNADLATRAGRFDIASDWEWLNFFFKPRLPEKEDPSQFISADEEYASNASQELAEIFQIGELDNSKSLTSATLYHKNTTQKPNNTTSLPSKPISNSKKAAKSKKPRFFPLNTPTMSNLKKEKSRLLVLLRSNFMSCRSGNKKVKANLWRNHHSQNFKKSAQHNNSSYTSLAEFHMRLAKPRLRKKSRHRAYLGSWGSTSYSPALKKHSGKKYPAQNQKLKSFSKLHCNLKPPTWFQNDGLSNSFYSENQGSRDVRDRAQATQHSDVRYLNKGRDLDRKSVDQFDFYNDGDRKTTDNSMGTVPVGNAIQSFFSSLLDQANSKNRKYPRGTKYVKGKIVASGGKKLNTNSTRMLDGNDSDNEWETLFSSDKVSSKSATKITGLEVDDLSVGSSSSGFSSTDSYDNLAQLQRSRIESGVTAEVPESDIAASLDNTLITANTRFDSPDEEGLTKLNQTIMRIVLDLIRHYSDIGNFQMSATIGLLIQNQKSRQSSNSNLSSYSRSSSNQNLIDLSTNSQFRDILYFYIKLLDKLQMFSVSNKILKRCNVTSLKNALSDNTYITWDCNTCGKTTEKLSTSARIGCTNCPQPYNICAVCLKPVLKMYVWCQGCGHGGHLEHISEWFEDKKQIFCPMGCGHLCNFKLG